MNTLAVEGDYVVFLFLQVCVCVCVCVWVCAWTMGTSALYIMSE